MNKDAFKKQDHYTHADLVELIELLRSPEGCPWDRVQTHHSIRRGVIEEAYEVAEAIDREDPAMMTEELGDLLMQVVFHISLGEQQGTFTAEQVYDRVCKKLVFRHPHIFADAPDASSSTEDGWAAIKRQEKGQTTLAEDLDGIAKTLPALTRAEKIAGKVYPREHPDPALLLQAAQNFSDTPDAEHLGAVLFTAARLAKALKIDPEEALHRANQANIDINL
ncbi:MAG: nucleotide pyrophosphohydrolase [Clostridia bacterium]|nr:nucleotide pyrophosphohydrolase [Clostridia bacterium]